MTDIFKGIAAGLAATALVSGLVLLKNAAGTLPQFDPIELLMHVLGLTRDRHVAWVVHFVLGSVLGGALFAWLEVHLPGESHARRGVLFGVLAWLAAMLLLLPLAGAGVFGLRLGVLAPLATLALYLVYGLLLGWLYGKLAPTRDPFAAPDHHRPA